MSKKALSEDEKFRIRVAACKSCDMSTTRGGMYICKYREKFSRELGCCPDGKW